MKAAFGKIVLTPKDVVGRMLAGYTPVQKCTGIYDDIHARAVLIEEKVLGNIKKRILLISMDFVQLPLIFTEYIKEQIQDAYKIHPNQILIHATHTHKSLDMSGMFLRPGGYGSVIWAIMFGAYRGDDRYKVWIARQIVKMVGAMIPKLRDAEMGWTKVTIEEDILLNRRNPLARSKSKMGVIAFREKQSKRIFGLIANYGMHPTTLSFPETKLSADYPGYLVSKISELSNNEVDTVFFGSAAGDLNPITTCGTDFEALEKDKTPIYKQLGGIKETTEIGVFLGERCWNIAQNIPEEAYYSRVEFKSYMKIMWVPMEDFTNYRNLNKVLNRFIHIIKRHFLFRVALILADVNEPNFPGFAAKHRGREINTYTQIQFIEFTASNPNTPEEAKKFSILGVPGELFEEFAEEFYQKSPQGKKNTFIFQTANDWIAYLFPLKDYMQGGYEPIASYAPICGEWVRINVLRLFEEIKYGITGGHY